jgi:uncharacterized protein (DUF1499 family)
MSSSSSLSGARRRRAGGQQPVSNNQPEPQTPQQPSPRPAGNAPAPNPYMLLQQHHVKINALEKRMDGISSGKSIESTHTNNTNNTNNTMNSQIDATEFSEMIINRRESQLDLKAFYENDTRLAGEMEELHKIVQSQQLLINEMNTTIFHVIQQLHLQEPDNVDSADNVGVEDMIVNMRNNVTFETSDINYAGIEDDDNLSNYEGAVDNVMGIGILNTMTFDGSNVDPSANLLDASNNM